MRAAAVMSLLASVVARLSETEQAMSPMRIRLVVGDITKLAMDAVVTAANESLRGGGGVDGAIHRAAGPALLDECRTIGICPEGEARITRGYLLPTKHIIHTVGPVWEGGGYDEAGTLRKAYKSTLALAEKHGLGTIAIPCIATGNYGFPAAQACEIAVDAVSAWLTEHELPREVTFCCYQPSDAELYNRRLARDPKVANLLQDARRISKALGHEEIICTLHLLIGMLTDFRPPELSLPRPDWDHVMREMHEFSPPWNMYVLSPGAQTPKVKRILKRAAEIAGNNWLNVRLQDLWDALAECEPEQLEAVTARLYGRPLSDLGA